MLKVGDRVQWRHGGYVGTVVDLAPEVFAVHQDDTDEHTRSYVPYSYLFDITGQGSYIEVIPPVNLATSDMTRHGFDRALSMAGNTGRMEATIEALWFSILRAITALNNENAGAAVTILASARESIIRCGEALRPIPKSNGTQEIPHLSLFIADHK